VFRGVARFIGSLLARLPTARRAAMVSNIAGVTGWAESDKRVTSAVSRAMCLQAENYVDLCRTPMIGDAEVRRRVSIEGPGWEQLRADALIGGAILVSAHVGRLELLGHALLRTGRRIVLVVEHLKPEVFHQLVRHLRVRDGLTVVTASEGARPLVRALRAGAVVVFLVDWLPPDLGGVSARGFRVAFGRRWIDVPASPFRLAARERVPLYFGYGIAQGNGCVRAVIEGRIAGPPDAEVTTSGHRSGTPAHEAKGDADARAMAEAVGRQLGNVLESEPGQWTLAHAVTSSEPERDAT
jgi:lauroyl/myristoyl acyltransferase